MKKFLFTCFTIITFLIALGYFLSCLTPYISPVVFWPMAFLALGFPYLALCIILLAFCWIFIKKVAAVCLLLLLFAGFQNLRATLAVNVPDSHNHSNKAPNTLRFVTWNVRGFDNPTVYSDTPGCIRRQMFEYLKKSKADVLCLQEFSNNTGPAFRSNYEDLSKIGYIYSYRTDEIKRVINGESVVGGTAIFSRIPIIDSGKVLLGDPSFPEHIAFVDVILQNKHLRIFTTHFKSLNLFALNRDPAAMVPFHYDTHFVYEASPFEKLKVFAQDHAKQSFVVKRELNKSPYPLIYAADMNSVPSSFPYHTVAKDLQDIFIKKGHGLGTTIDSLPKTLRIDFMLADKRIVIKSFWKDEVHLSDHFPQVADIAWKD